MVLGDSDYVEPNFTAFAVKEVLTYQFCLRLRQALISSHSYRSHL